MAPSHARVWNFSSYRGAPPRRRRRNGRLGPLVVPCATPVQTRCHIAPEWRGPCVAGKQALNKRRCPLAKTLAARYFFPPGPQQWYPATPAINKNSLTGKLRPQAEKRMLHILFAEDCGTIGARAFDH